MEQMQALNLDLYDDYDTYSNYNLNLLNLNPDVPQDELKDPLRSAYKWKTSSQAKGSAFQFIQDVESGFIKRPITAVHGAGYVSKTAKGAFDPLNLAAQLKSSPEDTPKEQSLEDRIKSLENQVRARRGSSKTLY